MPQSISLNIYKILFITVCTQKPAIFSMFAAVHAPASRNNRKSAYASAAYFVFIIPGNFSTYRTFGRKQRRLNYIFYYIHSSLTKLTQPFFQSRIPFLLSFVMYHSVHSFGKSHNRNTFFCPRYGSIQKISVQ